MDSGYWEMEDMEWILWRRILVAFLQYSHITSSEEVGIRISTIHRPYTMGIAGRLVLDWNEWGAAFALGFTLGIACMSGDLIGLFFKKEGAKRGFGELAGTYS